jgi:ribosomal protein L11 methyltransferase
MNYYQYNITPPQYLQAEIDIIIALLSDLPFESFEETETGLNAYIAEEKISESIDNQVLTLSKAHHFTYKKIYIPYQNWNAVWESNFEPIRVDDFVAVRADFHPNTEGVVFDLLINPQMAFGTGHHETTYMMMQMMRDLDFVGKKVLDYGCGTGILAILASKLKAQTIEAVDIELPSYENTIENARLNNVHNIIPFHGDLTAIHSTDFDIILANINRNIILQSLSDLKKMLNSEGIVLISGFLKVDEKVIKNAAKSKRFKVEKVLQKGNWLCMMLRKT